MQYSTRVATWMSAVTMQYMQSCSSALMQLISSAHSSQLTAHSTILQYTAYTAIHCVMRAMGRRVHVLFITVRVDIADISI